MLASPGTEGRTRGMQSDSLTPKAGSPQARRPPAAEISPLTSQKGLAPAKCMIVPGRQQPRGRVGAGVGSTLLALQAWLPQCATVLSSLLAGCPAQGVCLSAPCPALSPRSPEGAVSLSGRAPLSPSYAPAQPQGARLAARRPGVGGRVGSQGLPQSLAPAARGSSGRR